MSSVGSSDGSNRQDEVIRRQREEYNAREAEQAKKGKKEVRRLTETHAQEIETLKEKHGQQMESMREQSNDALSRRDHKYQKDAEEIRSMARKQKQESAEESARREELLRNTNKGDVNQQRAQNDARVDKLSKDYKESMIAREEVFRNGLNSAKESQDEAIKSNREKLNAAHQAETKAMRDERNSKVGDLEQQFGNYRQQVGSEKRSQELRNNSEKARSSDNLLRAVSNERAFSQDQQEILRDGFKDGLETMRDRYERQAQREREAQSLSSDSLKTTTLDRINNQVRRLENENMDLRDGNVRNDTKTKQEAARTIANVRRDAGKNVENWRQQRDEVLRTSNERNAEDVRNIREEMGKTLTDSNRYYRDRMEENSRMNRQSFNNVVGDFETKTEVAKSSADRRVKNVYDAANEDKARLTELMQENHVATQRSHQDEMKALRDIMENDKQQVVTRMQDQMRKQEASHTERLAQVVQKYEKTVQSLKDQNVRDKKSGEEFLKRTVDDLNRAHKVSMDQVESKGRERVRQLSNQQAEEIRSVNKRHEDRLDQVIVETKKT